MTETCPFAGFYDRQVEEEWSRLSLNWQEYGTTIALQRQAGASKAARSCSERPIYVESPIYVGRKI